MKDVRICVKDSSRMKSVRMNLSSSNSMSSISCNVSVKDGEIEDGVIGPSEDRESKKTMKMWYMGLLAR